MNQYGKILFPALAAMMLSACVSSELKEAQELNNRRCINSIKFPTTVRLQYTLKRGADPNLKDLYGVPILINAAAANKPEHVQLLLDCGANVHAADPDGETAVFSAASSGNIDILKMLMAKGASLNGKGRNGRTPAMEAARLGKFEMLKFLLDQGADLNAVDNDNAGLAAYAATAPVNAIEQLKFLESKGLRVDLNQPSLMGSPFLRALYFDKVETALKLLPGMNDFDKNDSMKEIGKIAAYYAISHNSMDLLKALVAKKLPLNYKEPFSFRFVTVMKIDGLYKLAARNDIIDKRYTPLMYACIFSRAEMVEFLVDSGANPFVLSMEGQVAQDYAKDRATLEMMERKEKEWKNKYYTKKQKQPGLIIERDKSIKRDTILSPN